MEIANEDLVFFGRGGSNNYRQLMSQKANEQEGQAFITEYAAPTSLLNVAHPLLQDLSSRYAYVTRLNTVISPEEMTVDPIFDYDSRLDDVSNVRDLSRMKGLFDCERMEWQNSPAGVVGSALGIESNPGLPPVALLAIAAAAGGFGVLAVAALVYLSVVIRGRSRD
jgi:hypothetical protein